MKIITWSIERPKKTNKAILDKLAEYNSDIIILTEKNKIINPVKDTLLLRLKL